MINLLEVIDIYYFDHSDAIKLYILNMFSFLAYQLKHHTAIKIEERKFK